MDPFRSKRPGGADDIKIAMDSVPKRYRNKMPSFRHLKGNPCAPYFMKLLQCYVLNDWEGSRCISEENEFLHCRKNSVCFN